MHIIQIWDLKTAGFLSFLLIAIRPEVDCTRGEMSQHTSVYRTSIYIAFLVVPLVIIGSLSAIYFHLRQEEQERTNYNQNLTSPGSILVLRDRRRSSLPSSSTSVSRMGLHKLLAYSGAWFVTHISYIITYVKSDLMKEKISLPLYFSLQLLYPLQGFCNFVVFIAPKVKAYQQQNRGKCFIVSLVNVVLNRQELAPPQNDNDHDRMTVPETMTSIRDDNLSSIQAVSFAEDPTMMSTESKSNLLSQEEKKMPTSASLLELDISEGFNGENDMDCHQLVESPSVLSYHSPTNDEIGDVDERKFVQGTPHNQRQVDEIDFSNHGGWKSAHSDGEASLKE